MTLLAHGPILRTSVARRRRSFVILKPDGHLSRGWEAAYLTLSANRRSILSSPRHIDCSIGVGNQYFSTKRAKTSIDPRWSGISSPTGFALCIFFAFVLLFISVFLSSDVLQGLRLLTCRARGGHVIMPSQAACYAVICHPGPWSPCESASRRLTSA